MKSLFVLFSEQFRTRFMQHVGLPPYRADRLSECLHCWWHCESREQARKLYRDVRRRQTQEPVVVVVVDRQPAAETLVADIDDIKTPGRALLLDADVKAADEPWQTSADKPFELALAALSLVAAGIKEVFQANPVSGDIERVREQLIKLIQLLPAPLLRQLAAEVGVSVAMQLHQRSGS